jgi:SAM-dependent methyltransferase
MIDIRSRPALRVQRDDPDYVRRAAAEAAFWDTPSPYGLDAMENIRGNGPGDYYTNRRLTGDRNTPWQETIPSYGPFRNGLVLGTSGMKLEARILEINPALHLTFVDISAGAVERRQQVLGAQFPGRVATLAGDLNFIELDANTYDFVVSSSTLHHIINLEHLAWQVNRALTANGRFFLQDYVGERRFDFSPGKRCVFEAIYHRHMGEGASVTWSGESDISPFCGVRSDEILPVMATYLGEARVRTASALLSPLLRTRLAEHQPDLRQRIEDRVLRGLDRIRGVRSLRRSSVKPAFFRELALVSDLLEDAGILLPGNAFAVYGKRTTATSPAPS